MRNKTRSGPWSTWHAPAKGSTTAALSSSGAPRTTTGTSTRTCTGASTKEVLAENSASELGPVLCAFDESWIGAVDPAVHGFRFERATTIALGGTRCPFHFSRES
ncbi:L-2-amino-thiazoline-4-carboxylic acid hydrolase [Saccharopolyspora antimicrobica]|uniref:L-2-amino-thiazoline-4-carboxylic acid hydrolase n=1 Tax=Saccharopolyspora antimicrobica TaxID=455193 RepID=UPI003F6DC0A0